MTSWDFLEQKTMQVKNFTESVNQGIVKTLAKVLDGLKGSTMNLTEFGSAVRKGRIDARVTLKEMAEELKVTPAYLSSLEVGRKKISEEWVKKIKAYFESKKTEVKDLEKLADVANKSISLDGMQHNKMMMLAGFARSNLSQEQIQKFAELLKEAEE